MNCYTTTAAWATTLAALHLTLCEVALQAPIALASEAEC